MTAFNSQQYIGGFQVGPIFGVEYGVGNWPLTGSMSLVGIRKSGSYYRIRPSTRLTPASLNSGFYINGNLDRISE